MINNIKKFINDKKGATGATYIELVISLYIFIILFIGAIMVMPIFSRQQDLDNFAKTILRQAEIDGTVDQNTCYRYLTGVYNITPNIIWEWDKYQGSKKVQLNHSIKVTLEDTYVFDVGGVLRPLNIPLKSIAYGKSEVYWK